MCSKYTMKTYRARINTGHDNFICNKLLQMAQVPAIKYMY